MSDYLQLPADNLPELTDLLLEGIKANNELVRLKEWIKLLADEGASAKTLLSEAVAPRPIDFNTYAAAEMIQILHTLPKNGESSEASA